MDVFDEWISGVDFFANSFDTVEKEIDDDVAGGDVIFPTRNQILSNLKSIRPTDVRVVLIGSQPYQSPHARGIPFAALHKTDTLTEIDIEMRLDCGQSLYDTSLQSWIDQGVLLLNIHETMSTKRKHSWAGYVDSVLDFIDGDIVIAVMGPHDDLDLLNRKGAVIRCHDPKHHLFHGSRIFSNINIQLLLMGQKPVLWGKTTGLYREIVG